MMKMNVQCPVRALLLLLTISSYLLLCSGPPPGSVVVIVAFAETLEARQGLFDFYQNNSKSTTCNGGGWLTLTTAPPATFCNSASPSSNSSFEGVFCDAPNGNIIELKLSNCGMNGTLTPSLGRVTTLQVLNLDLNSLTGTLPPEWASLTELHTLGLLSNQLTGTLPPEWSSMSSMSLMVIGANRFTGSLPPEWGTGMTQLKDLRLGGLGVSDAGLTGSLPREWSGMQSLTDVNLALNRLVGSLPPEWSQLTSLSSLQLHRNRLSGVLPASWATLPVLSYLQLSLNNLTGTLPAQWGRWSSMEYLFLSQNQLMGTLPERWSGMTSLKELSLYANHLVGTLPRGWPSAMPHMADDGTCNPTCTGTVGVNAECVLPCPCTCFRMWLWYNCLDVSTAALPPVNTSNAWNWANATTMPLGPQRSNCPKYIPPRTDSATWSTTPLGGSHSVTASASRTLAATETKPTKVATPMRTGSATWSDTPLFGSHSVTVTSSLTVAVTETKRTEEATLSVTEGSLTARSTTTVSDSRSAEPPIPARLPRLQSTSEQWASGSSAVGAVLASLIGGAGIGMAVQRAAVLRALVGCGGEGSDEDMLDWASSPTQLGYGSVVGFYLRGSLVGDVTLLLGLASLALLAVLFVWWKNSSTAATNINKAMKTRVCPTFRRAATQLQMPGLLHIPVLFWFQPIVTASVWCLSASHEDSVSDTIVGIVGLSLSIGYALWATWVCSGGRRAYFSIHPPRMENDVWSARMPRFIRRGLLGIHDTSGEWRDDDTPLPSQEDKHRHTTSNGFVERYGTILCSYRGNRQWFVMIDLLLALGSGTLAGVAIANQEALCKNTVVLPVLYCVLLLAVLVLTISIQPYAEPLDHVANVLGLTLSLLGVLSALFAGSEEEGGSNAANEILAEIQLWLGVALLVAAIVALLGSPSYRLTVLHRLFRHRINNNRPRSPQQQPQQQQGGERVTIDDDISVSLRTTTTPEDSLRALIGRVCLTARQATGGGSPLTMASRPAARRQRHRRDETSEEEESPVPLHEDALEMVVKAICAKRNES